jgi:ADP-ribose pyrophosphatase
MEYFDFIKKYPEHFSNEDAPYKLILDPDKIRAWQEEMKSNEMEENFFPNRSAIGVRFEDPYIILLRDLIEFPDGSLRGYSRVFFKGSLMGGVGVAVLPTMQGKVLLIRNYRHSFRSWLWEIPRGYGEPGISAEENVRRELKEEIGATCESIHDLGDLHPNTGLENLSARLLLAFITDPGKCDLNEGISNYQLISIEEMERLIATGEIADSFAIAAFTRARLRKLI